MERQLGLVPPGELLIAWTLCPRKKQMAGQMELVLEGGGFPGASGFATPVAALVGAAGSTDWHHPLPERRSAFCWRGDMDLYDTLTFQSIEGLEGALKLAARYAFPQTMFYPRGCRSTSPPRATGPRTTDGTAARRRFRASSNG